ncbi:MAG: TlpA disulfide reductase family protein [Anaerolineales bacterium]|jgi:thiol-disulfide isomerase/thioredoxin
MSLSKIFQDDRYFAIAMFIVFLLGSGWMYLSRVPQASTTNGAPPPSPREGFSAPNFSLELMSGGEEHYEIGDTVTLSDLIGDVVILNLWASWCPPCRAEMPAIQSVYEDYKDQGLEVLAVNTTYQDDPLDAANFIKEHSLTFPVLRDTTGVVSKRYQLRGLPSTYFIDRKGVIRSVVVGGPMSEALIRSKIQNLVEGNP